MSDFGAMPADGQTLLPEDEQASLLQHDIVTLQELFEAEQRNIAKALLRPRPTLQALLDMLKTDYLKLIKWSQIVTDYYVAVWRVVSLPAAEVDAFDGR